MEQSERDVLFNSMITVPKPNTAHLIVQNFESKIFHILNKLFYINIPPLERKFRRDCKYSKRFAPRKSFRCVIVDFPCALTP